MHSSGFEVPFIVFFELLSMKEYPEFRHGFFTTFSDDFAKRLSFTLKKVKSS